MSGARPAAPPGPPPATMVRPGLGRGAVESSYTRDDVWGARLEAVTAERDKLSGSCQLLARTLSVYVRTVHAAWIDAAQHGDLKAATETLAEMLDGFDGPAWNGTETGAEWLDRTATEDVP